MRLCIHADDYSALFLQGKIFTKTVIFLCCRSRLKIILFTHVRDDFLFIRFHTHYH